MAGDPDSADGDPAADECPECAGRVLWVSVRGPAAAVAGPCGCTGPAIEQFARER